MKKIISILLVLMLAVSVFATVTVASAADELIVNSWDFTETWEDYSVVDYTGASGRTMKLKTGNEGDWAVHYEYANSDIITVVDESWRHEGAPSVNILEGHGNAVYVNNFKSNGTYVNIGYVGKDPDGSGDAFYARNFTLEYDLMPLHPDKDSGWAGCITRWTGNGVPNVHYSNSVNCISTVSMTTGSSADKVILPDGTTRPATSTDYGYHSRSATASNTGANDMTYESGIDKVSDRFYRIDGGGMRYTWFTIRIEAKDTYYTIYLKEACGADCEDECTLHRWFDTGTRYYDDPQNNVYSGTIGLGQCASEYVYDNIKFKSNDGNSVTAVNTMKDGQGQEIGKARATSSTAADGSIIELVSETEAGYVFDKWYKDSDFREAVTPVEFVLQESVLNVNYGLYDWENVLGATDGIKTWNDLETKTVFVKDNQIVSEGTDGAEEMLWRDYYATSADRKFRLITKVKTGAGQGLDGYEFYSTASLKEFKVKVYSNDETMGSVSITGVEGSVGEFVLGQQGVLVATPQSGYKFAGWYLEVKGENPDDKGAIKDETFTIKASGNPNFDYTLTEPANVTYKAVFVPEGAGNAKLVMNYKALSETVKDTPQLCGTVVTPAGEENPYFEGEIVTLIAKENDGYAFVGWQDINSEYISTDKYYDYTVAQGDNEITAVFEIETFRIFVKDGIGSDEVERTAQANSRLTLYPATAPTGYVFDRWLVTGIADTDWSQDETGKLELSVTSRTIRVEAQFLKVRRQVRLQFDSALGSAIGSGSKSVGDKVTVSVTCQEGYSVSRYIVRGLNATLNENGTLSFTMPDEDVIIRIEFATIDKIELESEVIMYAVFALVGLGIVASILFANTKDKRDKNQ